MNQPVHVRVFYCTREVRGLMAELPLDGLLSHGAKTLSPGDFEYLKEQLAGGRSARIEGPDCWFEYELVSADAA